VRGIGKTFQNKTYPSDENGVANIKRKRVQIPGTILIIKPTGYVDCLLASSQHNPYHIYLLLCIQY